ncbi:hypothetical protein [Dyadobacter arcticus]|uniref:Uncharacterized protein n=1 Tax=Dyadobacter arcticus TaxID=1078754 RepID=A0ABX0UI59_9BACT|nr:hypothetical protein [Dyadobacter arcticus]NIJ52696.1 hypothetical protein [Dyadobacter arcticus]
MTTFHDLLFEHRNRTIAIIQKYMAKYRDTEYSKTVDTWNLFVLDNARDVIADLTQSGSDVFHDSIANNVVLKKEDFNAIKKVNLDAAARYQEGLKELYLFCVDTAHSQSSR